MICLRPSQDIISMFSHRDVLHFPSDQTTINNTMLLTEFKSIDLSTSGEKLQEFDREVLHERSFLDKGVFGHVWLVELLEDPSELQKLESRESQDFGYATKYQQRNPRFALKCINPNVADPEEAALQLTNEARILSELDHENIIKIRGVGSETFSGSLQSRNFFLLLDVLDETLEDRLERWGKEKATNIRRKFRKLISNDSNHRLKDCQRMYRRIYESTLGIARGMEYLHQKKIVWCDVKPANIGFYMDARALRGGRPETTVKLFDFGMAAKVEDCDDGESRGSLRYMSPEVMNGKRYTLEADVFSYGVLLAQICALRVPYSKAVRTKKLSLGDFQNKVKSGELRPVEDLEKAIPCTRLLALIEECLGAPAGRPTCTQIVQRLATIFVDPGDKLNESISTSLSMTRLSIEAGSE